VRKRFSNARIALFGSSLGGMVSIMASSMDKKIRYVGKRFSNARIALFGSSLGGMVSIMASSMDKKIMSLSVLSRWGKNLWKI